MHLPVGFDRLEFLLNVAKTHVTETSFALGVALAPSFDFIGAFFLSLEFGVVEKVRTF